MRWPSVLIEIAKMLGGIVDFAERTEVALVGRSSDLLESWEVDDALVHRQPAHRADSLAGPHSSDPELIGTVDHRFDPQDLAVLVIHLDHVLVVSMLDPRALVPLFVVGDDFALVLLGQFPPEKGEDVLTGETKRRMASQSLVKRLECRPGSEDHVGRVLGLIANPVVVEIPEEALQERIRFARKFVEDFDPLLSGKAVGNLLGFPFVFEPSKSIVGGSISDLAPVQLALQPRVAVDADLDGEGKPGLEADVHQTQLRIQEIEVNKQTLAKSFEKLGVAFSL